MFTDLAGFPGFGKDSLIIGKNTHSTSCQDNYKSLSVNDLQSFFGFLSFWHAVCSFRSRSTDNFINPFSRIRTMAKEEIRIEERDGVQYRIVPAKSGGQIVGLAPVEITDGDTPQESLVNAVETYGDEVCHELIVRQVTTDRKNAVRARATSTKLKASDVIAMFCEGKLQASEVQENAKRWGVDTTTAAERMVHEEPDAERIHWDLIAKKA
jgi:hypothetical protein